LGSSACGAIAAVAHSATQTKSLMQASVTTYAMVIVPRFLERLHSAVLPHDRAYRGWACCRRDSNHKAGGINLITFGTDLNAAVTEV
jgi:hypothetical protein